ncbi:MAG TPA: hypothetical protein VN698_08935 [Bacteroidia bacterium]|nr:hypothetical protein [Bacteroidia bacterium]
METTKSSNETLNESAKVVENLFNNTNAAMTDMYKKQMDLTTSFYNNLFGSKLGNTNMWNQNSGFPNMFSNNMDMTKWFSNPFANFSAVGMQNPFMSPFDKTMKQMMEFNQNLLSAFTNGFSAKGNNFGAMSEEFEETIETRLEASKEIFNTISEAFKKKLESSVETNKKVIEEMSTQFNLVMKQNQKLWADLLNAYQTPLNNEEKKSKEPIMNDSKKRSNVLATDFKDHKG